MAMGVTILPSGGRRLATLRKVVNQLIESDANNDSAGHPETGRHTLDTHLELLHSPAYRTGQICFYVVIATYNHFGRLKTMLGSTFRPGSAPLLELGR